MNFLPERIANDVLSLSRIQLQVLSIHPVDFDLVPEIKRIVAIFYNELKMYNFVFWDNLIINQTLGNEYSYIWSLENP
jgi:hypothetical protein